MEKGKQFEDVRFSPEVLREARDQLFIYLNEDARKYLHTSLWIQLPGGEEWSYDNEEEFFADYRLDHNFSRCRFGTSEYSIKIDYNLSYRRSTEISVTAPSRQQIESIFEIFEKHAEQCKMPPLPRKEADGPKPKIFIGHGKSNQWKDLKDHLHEKHGYDIIAYEVGARAGHTIRDILEEMLSKSSIAILVMTGEDKDEHGQLRARQNVIHELGLFQGHLGFTRAIVLLEEGTEEFSNIYGINQIRFGKNNIKEIFGEVLATLRREFGE